MGDKLAEDFRSESLAYFSEYLEAKQAALEVVCELEMHASGRGDRSFNFRSVEQRIWEFYEQECAAGGIVEGLSKREFAKLVKMLDMDFISMIYGEDSYCEIGVDATVRMALKSALEQSAAEAIKRNLHKELLEIEKKVKAMNSGDSDPNSDLAEEIASRSFAEPMLELRDLVIKLEKNNPQLKELCEWFKQPKNKLDNIFFWQDKGICELSHLVSEIHATEGETLDQALSDIGSVAEELKNLFKKRILPHKSKNELLFHAECETLAAIQRALDAGNGKNLEEVVEAGEWFASVIDSEQETPETLRGIVSSVRQGQPTPAINKWKETVR